MILSSCSGRWPNEGLDVSMTIGLMRRVCFVLKDPNIIGEVNSTSNPSLLQMQRMNLAEALHDSCRPSVFQLSRPCFPGFELNLAEAIL